MGSSREDSPDWLREFQPPTRSVTTLSSDSEPSGDKSPTSDGSDWEQDGIIGDKDGIIGDIAMKSDANKSSRKKTTKKQVKVDDDELPAKRRKTLKQKKRGSEDEEDVKREESCDDQMETSVPNHLVLALSSDSEADTDAALSKKEPNEESANEGSLKLLVKEEKNHNEQSAPKAATKKNSPKKQPKTEDVRPPKKKHTNDNVKVEGEVGDTDVPEEKMHEKHVEPRVSSSKLPLVLPEKVYRSKALVECEGESIDLGGDMGAVGRVIIPETPSKEPEMFFDLKGTIYKTTIVPSRTFCVVSIGQSEAKIEAIMNDFIQLTPQSNVYDAETMVEGTLDGFSFDSEDEADKMTKDKDVKGDQNEDAEEKPKAKPKGKAVKKLGATQKKGKAAGGKQPKKRKTQAPKRGKKK